MISIVTISYNQAEYLSECINSVLSQKNIDLEYIIVDPGSKDESRTIINSYGNKIIKIYEPDNGPADGLNKGFTKAKGDLFFYLNADDVLLPGALSFAQTFFDLFPKYDILQAGGYIIDSNSKIKKRVYPTYFNKHFYLYGAINFFQQGFFFKSQSFKKINGFNSNNKTFWDGELALDMFIRKSKFIAINYPLGKFRIHPLSLTGSPGPKNKYYLQKMELFEKHFKRKKTTLDVIYYYILWITKQFTLIWIILYSEYYTKKVLKNKSPTNTIKEL